MRMAHMVALSLMLSPGLGCEDPAPAGLPDTGAFPDTASETDEASTADGLGETDDGPAPDVAGWGDLDLEAICQPVDHSDLATTVPTAPGEYVLAMPYGDDARRYNLKIPASYDHQAPVPLVLAFHGGGGSAGNMTQQRSDLRAAADAGGFILAFMEGYPGMDTGNQWHAPHCCGAALVCDADDVGYVAAIVDELKVSLEIDPARVYAAGFSNGGMFTHHLGAALPGVFAAVAACAGTIGGNANAVSERVQIAPSVAMPIILHHGVNDTHVTFGGGLSAGDPGRYDIAFEESVALWVSNNGCDPTPAASTETTSKGTVTLRHYGGCTAGADVVAVAVDGLAHAWPAAEDTGGYDGTAAILQFFVAHPKP